MSLKSIQSLVLILVITMISSCGKTTEEEVEDNVRTANVLLSTSQCQPAIDLLETIGRQPKNSYYLKTLSTAYACRAGYSTVTFFGSDVAKTATPAPLGGMTTYSTSTVTVTSPLTDDLKFRDLQTAINILLYAGGIATTTEPSTTERARYFSLNQVGDIDVQLAYMMLVQLGKLMKYYADTSAAGVKGGGTGTNTCFTDYSATDALTIQAYLTPATTGACVTTNSAHSELALFPAVADADRRKRLCEGVILLNNIFNVLPSVLATAGGGDLATISNMTAQIDAKKTALVAFDPTYATTATVLSQSNCENSVNINLIKLSSYYAIFFESLVK